MEVPSHRACAFCRSQKVRCIMDGENEDACQRCVKGGRSCVFTPLQKRRQRKRTDTRVAELEREMKAMRSMLKEKQQQAMQSSDVPVRKGAPPMRAQGVWFKEHSAAAPRWEAFDEGQGERESGRGQPAIGNGQDAQAKRADPFLWPYKQVHRPLGDAKDVVDRGLISMATARQLFESYRNDLFPHYPMVYVPDSGSADDMRERKPILFLAILAAAAGKQNPEVSAMLDKEVLHAYATKSLVRSEKSLELVQALLLSSVWYHPPNKFGQLKYYEYVHMAATMALDIGIGTRPISHRSRFGRNGQQQARNRGPNAPSMHPLEDAMNPDLSMTPRSGDSSPDTGSIESRRTFLACFTICAAVSMSLRRPNMLRASSYIRESVDYIERSRDAVPSDRTVVAWAKLIMIQDEICSSFAYDDPGGIACITELRTQIMLKDFSHRLTGWWTGTPEVDMTGSLIITYYTTRLYLHEIALHVDHSPEDFKAPYQMGVIEPWQGEEIPSQVLAEAIAECINCAHSLLNTFLSMSPESLRALPVFSFVRVSFAAFILAKLCLSAAHPDSRIGRVLDRSSLKAESFLERAIHHVREVVGTVRSRVPAIFLALLFKLRAWCLHPEMIEWPDADAAASTVTDQLTVGRAGGQSHTFRNAHGSHSSLMASAIEGPRVVEQSSGDESSPAYSERQILLGEDVMAQGQARASTTGGRVVPGQSEITPQSIPSDSNACQGSSDSTKGNTMSMTGAITIPQTPAENTNYPNTTYTTAFPNPDINFTNDTNAFTNGMNSSNDQMQLDDAEFLNYFGDMNGLAEGGLTGLDDWGDMPTDLMGFDGGFGYQFEGQRMGMM